MNPDSTRSVKEMLSLEGQVVVVTGACGLLGRQHAEAIAEAGGIPVIADLDKTKTESIAREIRAQWDVDAFPVVLNVADKESVTQACDTIVENLGSVHGLVNNAANNPPPIKPGETASWTRFENFPLEVWEADIAVGLTGAFFCSQVFGALMARANRGAILNIASDLSVIAPDQRLYRVPDVSDDEQPVKSVSYSAIKSGLVGLTRYLATYWAENGVRVNALSPGGIYTDQDPDFVQRLSNLIPLGRMARQDEYKGVVVFLLSDAAAYLTGQNIIVDGGRTVW